MLQGIYKRNAPANAKPDTYYCVEHSRGVDHTTLALSYRERLHVPGPRIYIQGPLVFDFKFWSWLKSISFVFDRAVGGVQDLPIISLKTALLLDGPWEGMAEGTVSTRFAGRYGLLITYTSAKGGGWVAMAVRRIQRGPFADRNHDPITDTKQYTIVEAVFMGPKEKTIEDAVISFNIDLGDKVRHRKIGKIEPDTIHQIFAPLEYRGELSFFRNFSDIEEYDQVLHGKEDLFTIWTEQHQGSPKTGVYMCLGGKEGTWRNQTVLGPWVLLNFALKEKERDIEVLTRDPRHCGVCSKCLHGLL